jgi:hypothetical protein
MKKTLKLVTYKCKCGGYLKEYIWLDELKDIEFNCIHCENILTYKDIPKPVQVTSIRTPTKNR